MKNENDQLKKENGQLRSGTDELQNELRLLRDQAETLKTAKTKAETDAKEIQGMLIMKQLGGTGPTDEEVERGFRELNHAINQFVLKNCRNHSNHKGMHGWLPVAAKDSYVVSHIADLLHVNLFSSKHKVFGFPKWNGQLTDLEAELSESGKGNIFLLKFNVEPSWRYSHMI